MDKSTKLYSKALDMYNKGYIDRALDLCEQGISENIKNSATINLKGLLLYLKGDLDSAQKLWKMNVQINKDGVSEKYLKDSKKDEEKFILYTKAVKLVNEIKVKEALKILHKCNESDYNSLNVNNYIAICYMRQGNYDEAVKFLDKVLAVDKENIIALDTMKTLRNLGVVKTKINYKYIGTVAVSAVIFIGLIYLGKIFIGNFKNINYAFINRSNIISKGLNKNKASDKEKKNELAIKDTIEGSIPNVGQEKVEQEEFPYDNLNKSIEAKDYNKIYDILKVWKNKDVKVNDKVLINKGNELLSSSGVEYFYITGYDYIKNKEYKNAQDIFLKAYEYGKNHYLYSEIVYMMGLVSEDVGDIENALKYYIEYDSNFSNGPYGDIVIYNIANIYNSTGNDNKAKEFAQKLVNKYPNTIYNNNKIKNILAKS